MAQQKGWEKQKAPQGQNPQARMTLGMEIVQDSQNLNHAACNIQHLFPQHHPSHPALLSHRKDSQRDGFVCPTIEDSVGELEVQPCLPVVALHDHNQVHRRSRLDDLGASHEIFGLCAV